MNRYTAGFTIGGYGGGPVYGRDREDGKVAGYNLQAVREGTVGGLGASY